MSNDRPQEQPPKIFRVRLWEFLVAPAFLWIHLVNRLLGIEGGLPELEYEYEEDDR